MAAFGQPDSLLMADEDIVQLSLMYDPDEVFFQIREQGGIEAARAALEASRLVEMIASYEDLLDRLQLSDYEVQLRGVGVTDLNSLRTVTAAMLAGIGVAAGVAQSAVAYLQEYFGTGYHNGAADTATARRNFSAERPARGGLTSSSLSVELEDLLADSGIDERLEAVLDFHSVDDERSRIEWMKLFAALLLTYPTRSVYIYGGFVRDYIVRAEEPNDIDCRLVGAPADWPELLSYLVANAEAYSNDSVAVTLSADTSRPKQHIVRVSVCAFDSVGDDVSMLRFSIDTSFASHYEQAVPPRNLTDCSPNNLKVSRGGGLEKKSDADPMTVTDVVRHIINKQFTPLVELNDSPYWQGRFGKLVAKGYMPVEFSFQQ